MLSHAYTDRENTLLCEHVDCMLCCVHELTEYALSLQMAPQSAAALLADSAAEGNLLQLKAKVACLLKAEWEAAAVVVSHDQRLQQRGGCDELSAGLNPQEFQTGLRKLGKPECSQHQGGGRQNRWGEPSFWDLLGCGGLRGSLNPRVEVRMLLAVQLPQLQLAELRSMSEAGILSDIEISAHLIKPPIIVFTPSCLRTLHATERTGKMHSVLCLLKVDWKQFSYY